MALWYDQNCQHIAKQREVTVMLVWNWQYLAKPNSSGSLIRVEMAISFTYNMREKTDQRLIFTVCQGSTVITPKYKMFSCYGESSSTWRKLKFKWRVGEKEAFWPSVIQTLYYRGVTFAGHDIGPNDISTSRQWKKPASFPIRPRTASSMHRDAETAISKMRHENDDDDDDDYE